MCYHAHGHTKRWSWEPMMPPTTEPTIAEIWERVRTWPAAERIALASRILLSLEREQAQPAAPPDAVRPRKTLADLWGIMATDKPPPTDEEVERIIEEEIMRKYG
jgi:hypothetical protein